MKTLIWNGSPRKNGSTAYLISELKQGLNGEVRVVDVYREAIEPCLDCRACWKNPGCVQKDAMQELYSDIINSDNLVIASPIYFSELTGPLLSALSRLQMFYAARRFLKKEYITKTKRGAVILCGGGDGSAETAKKTACCLLKHMKAEPAHVIISHHTDVMESWKDSAAIAQIHALAAEWNQ